MQVVFTQFAGVLDLFRFPPASLRARGAAMGFSTLIGPAAGRLQTLHIVGFGEVGLKHIGD